MAKGVVWDNPGKPPGQQSPSGLLTQDRIDRVNGLIDESYRLLDESVCDHIVNDDRGIAAVVLLFSGGNDSTTMAHLFKDRSSHALHCNTGIGVEQTRQFVRDTCKIWEVPLLEISPPDDDTYEQQIIKRGFPGPTQHPFVFWRLKGRQMSKGLKQLNPEPRKNRVVFIGGRRRAESRKRKDLPVARREGSAVYVDPLVNWTAIDLNTYRLMYPDMPHNEVTDMLHKSGECLCGAYSSPEDLDEIGLFFPEVVDEIKRLEIVAVNAGQKQCQWGWAKSKNTCQNGCNL